MKDVDDNEIYRLIGERLKQLREDAGLKQNYLADQVNVLRTSISNIESGRQRLPLHLLYKICLVLGVEVTNVIPGLSRVVKENVVAVETENGIKEMPPKAAELLRKIINT